MNATQEGVLIVSDDTGVPIAVVCKDAKTRHNLFYTIELADTEEIQRLLNHKK